ncbi:MAG TPA: ferric reductase-like transmembrane domain-containing protein [Longimicrobiales bacterium]|nr:ferric reductase-like transmembrane domain-containing protein [Longimicrobiales bacterium]
MSAIDLSSTVGLVALVLLTVNLLLGLLLSVRYNPWTHWPHRRFNYFEVHNWTGYVALAVSALHPLILLFSSTAGFDLLDLVYPVTSPKQPLENTFGAMGLYALALVVATSYVRRRFTRRSWKRLHYVAYMAAAFFFVHGILTDPKLENRPVDYFDGEKVLVEVCLLLVAAASAWRARYALQRRKAGLPPVGASRQRRAGAAPEPA